MKKRILLVFMVLNMSLCMSVNGSVKGFKSVLDTKKDFPIFKNHKNLIYFDTAATAQRPQVVLDAVIEFYTLYNANAGRAIYGLAERAIQECNTVRTNVAQFINAKSESEIIFTRGATGGINFIATSWGDKNIQKGDEIVITGFEHHANFVPWQQLCKKKEAVLKVIPVDKNGQLVIDDLNKLITSKTKLVAMTQISNALGLPNQHLAQLTKAAHTVGARVLIDGAQVSSCHAIDVQKLECDFYVFSGHKMYGPTGIGVLYIKKEVQPDVPPYQYGGGSVEHVSSETVTFLNAPACYETGTQPLAGIVGLGAAIKYLQSLGLGAVFQHENKLVNQLIDGLEQFSEITILGSKERLRKESTLVSFLIDGLHPHDIAAFFDTKGICIRAGHHCVQPLARAMNYTASARISFGIYNNAQEVSYFLTCLKELLESDLIIKPRETVNLGELGKD
jgi:cysteine desulfurase/selenocysteine lyase